ncbi:beta-galactosidase [Poseidonocella sedimentorum]|uniref:Beta-galactosidase n=1 Tax=Poseidonocella sedimentorum TaxID=871652 RepID=A0A1I6D6H3_9RHOB|nr:beta-galactosidase [Poseidonocella sedimentorum]SFR00951.1 beta-galactosidase [Poseidonocella sedimentorum]
MTPSLGVCYYPEHWPEETWAEDAAHMVRLGLSWVRIGEFAWSRMEPEPGDLRLDWLDRATETLGAAGLKVILGTPTATPPRWMIDKHPDMLAVDANGQPRKFGSRRHYCFSHAGYRDESARIVAILARRYGANPHVAAWQTDNEYGCHDTVLSYSDPARRAFRIWLAARYDSIEALNAAWANVFWSMDYRSFDEIDLPNLTVTEPNPAHVMAFRRFSSDQVIQYNRMQAEILRAHTDAPLIHNYMGRITEFDHYEVGEDLDIASWDSYPIGFLSDRLEASDAHKQAFLRQGDPDMQAFHHDIYRRVGKGRWWVMEQQPGPVNWAPYNPAPLPGMVRLWTWEAFAHGAETVSYFRWRQAPFAQEQMHAGLLRPNRTEAEASAELRQVAEEIAELGDVEPARARVALIFDYPSAWAWETQPQGADFDYFRLVFAFYKALRSCGLTIDILPARAPDIAGYDLVLAPGLMEVGAPFVEALQAQNGLVVLGPRAGHKTDEMATILPEPCPISELGGALLLVESVPPSEVIPLQGGGAFCHWVERVAATETVAERTVAGDPAVLRKDGLAYLCGWPDAPALGRMLRAWCAERDVPTLALPEGLRLRDTATHRFVFNYSAVPLTWDGTQIPPAGVHWEMRK